MGYAVVDVGYEDVPLSVWVDTPSGAVSVVRILRLTRGGSTQHRPNKMSEEEVLPSLHVFSGIEGMGRGIG